MLRCLCMCGYVGYSLVYEQHVMYVCDVFNIWLCMNVMYACM